MDNETPRFKYNDPDGVPRDLRYTDIPPIFLANSGDEVDNYIKEGECVHEIFMGYNALQWHCDALTTSPSTIRALVKHGIDMDALDYHKLPNPAAASADECQHPPMARRTALGYACCNGNLKAVRTLLELGAHPLGNLSPDLPDTPEPSPLQDLLSRQIRGPTGVCPNKVHIEPGHLMADHDDKDVRLPARQGLLRMYGPVRKEPECELCSYGFDAHKLGFVDSIFMSYKAQAMYGEQVYLASYRTYECANLLTEYARSLPFPLLYPLCHNVGHDERLPPPLDCLLRSVWYYLGPTLMCWGDSLAQKCGEPDPRIRSRKELVQFAARFARHDPAYRIIVSLRPWAGMVQYAAEASTYASKAVVPKVEQPDSVLSQILRLLELLENHPDLDNFPCGRFFDFDATTAQQNEIDGGSNVDSDSATLMGDDDTPRKEDGDPL